MFFPSEILYCYITFLMDNIGIEAYVVCCILPLVAFLALAGEIYLGSFAKNSRRSQMQPRGDHFLQSMQGFITIIEQKKREPEIDEPQIQSERGQTVTSSGDETAQNMGGYQSLKKGGLTPRRSLLNGCSAGLARMKQINEAYLNSRKGYYASCLKQAHLKRIRRQGKEDFKPTFLPIIVEGLQY